MWRCSRAGAEGGRRAGRRRDRCGAEARETLTGDTLCAEDAPGALPPSVPGSRRSRSPSSRRRSGDEDKISNALHRIAEEDPTLRHHYDPETKQLLISGVGQLHIEVVVERMKRKYNVEVQVLPPRIPYKETVKGRAEVQGEHKKQTGGRGQFGDCWIRDRAARRGGGFEFVDKIFGGAIPRNFIPSVEKGVRDGMSAASSPATRWWTSSVTLYDGSYHDVDSSDMAFQLAAADGGCRRPAWRRGRCLLEPIMDVEVTAPSEIAGDVIGDLNSRRGRIVGHGAGDGERGPRPGPDGRDAEVRAASPLDAGGRGGYSMEFSHYEEVPRRAGREGGDRGEEGAGGARGREALSRRRTQRRATGLGRLGDLCVRRPPGQGR